MKYTKHIKKLFACDGAVSVYMLWKPVWGCRAVTVWLSVLKVRVEGLTGNIQFDQHGKRVNYSVNIMELKTNGPVKVRIWMAPL